MMEVPLNNASNQSCNSTISPHDYTAYITMISSCFSMIGSALIIITFILWKDIRTFARAIVVFLAIADFFTAAGYLFGAIVSYKYKHDHYDPDLYNSLCKAQSFVTTAFPISSFLWTTHLAIYLYVAIVNENPSRAKKLLIFFHITGWGIPLAICLPAVLTNHLGGSNERTSVNWCFIYFDNTNPNNSNVLRHRLAEYYGFEFLCGKFWEIAASFVAVYLYVSVKVVLRRRRMKYPERVVKSVAYGSLNMERKINAAMLQLDQKLIFIPLVFILLRMWGTMRFFISFAPSCHYPCGNSLIVRDPCKRALYNPFLMVMQALCDPGQGWGNALIFVVFHKTILKRLCPCIFIVIDKLKKKRYSDSSEDHRPTSPSVNESSSKSRDPLLSPDDHENGHHTPIPSDECDKRYHQRRSHVQSITSSFL